MRLVTTHLPSTPPDPALTFPRRAVRGGKAEEREAEGSEAEEGEDMVDVGGVITSGQISKNP
jgi:hypothetical protein